MAQQGDRRPSRSVTVAQGGNGEILRSRYDGVSRRCAVTLYHGRPDRLPDPRCGSSVFSGHRTVRTLTRPSDRAAKAPSAETDRHWMSLALAAARRAAARGEVPVGAVLVDGGGRIATGSNRTLAGGDPTLHAEIVALRRAARRCGNYRLPVTRLYVTLEPCPMCLGALLWARTDEIVYALPDPKAGAVESVVRLLEGAFPHRLTARRGPGAEESAALLRSFFRARRPRGGMR